MTSTGTFTLDIRPLTPDLLDSMRTVLRGSWGSICWCMFPRITRYPMEETPRRRVRLSAPPCSYGRPGPALLRSGPPRLPGRRPRGLGCRRPPERACPHREVPGHTPGGRSGCLGYPMRDRAQECTRPGGSPWHSFEPRRNTLLNTALPSWRPTPEPAASAPEPTISSSAPSPSSNAPALKSSADPLPDRPRNWLPRLAMRKPLQ